MTASPRNRTTIAAVVLALAHVAHGQLENPVYVDDSPRAWELFQRAREQAADNVGESVRLYQELLDDYGQKLIPIHPSARGHFVAVRLRVLADLADDDEVLARYRTMQTPEAERLHAAGAWQELALTRALTAPGLDALLRLGQRALEDGHFRTAVGWIEQAVEHPDLGGEAAAHAWSMLGLAHHYLGDTEATAEAEAQLAALGDVAARCRAELADLLAAGQGPAVVVGVSALDRTTTDDLAGLVAQTIWSKALDESLMARRFADPATGIPPGAAPSLGRRHLATELATVAATVAGPVVYVNEGHTVRALDRFTGRAVWSRPWSDRSNPDRESESPLDLNAVAVEADMLVTLTGHALSTSRSGRGRVVALDARTGALRWTAALDRIGGDEEYDQLFPHGAPIIREGRVYILARKVTPQLLTGSYAVALDLETGRLEWIRHLASSGDRSRRARSFSSLVADGDSIFVASAVGATARLDAATGTIRWLRRDTVPPTVQATAPRRPWEIGGPVVVGERVIAISPDHRRITVLDRSTGDVLEEQPAGTRSAWNSPSYLLASDEMVYAVGEEIRAFRTDSLGHPFWRLPAPRTSRVEERDADRGFDADAAAGAEDHPAPLAIAGRVQLVSGAMIVPTDRGALVVDDETGHVLHELDLVATGNPLAIDSQLILASASSLDAYMSLDRAEEMLRHRIVTAPDDPEPSLALFQLALRVGSLDLALEAARLALGAIEARPPGLAATAARADLFAMLLEFHHRHPPASVADGEALYEMLGDVAETAEQRVEHELAFGMWLAGHDPARAVEVLQGILSDRLLADTARSEGGIRRPAMYWAARELVTLIDQHGREIAAAGERVARRRLDETTASGHVNAQRLEAIAREFPFTDAAVEAAVLAARLHAASGEPLSALGVLVQTYRMVPDRHRARHLLGPFVELCLAVDARDEAREVLETLVATWEELSLDTAEGPREARAWLAALDEQRPASLAPRLGMLGENAELLPGTLLPRHPAAADGVGAYALLQQGPTLRLLRGPGLDPAWTSELHDPEVSILQAGADDLLLVIGRDPRVLCLDVTTGSERWMTPRVGEVIDEPIGRQAPSPGQLGNGLPFDPEETLVLLDPSSVIFAQRTGGVVAFDRADGTAVRWSAEETLEEVHLVAAHAYGLVLAGLDRPIDAIDGGRLEPRIVVLERETGRVLHRLRPQGRAGVIWMQVDPFGRLVCATSEGLEMFDLLAGRRLWTNVAYAAHDTRHGWRFGRQIVVEDRASQLRRIAIETGALSEAFEDTIHGDVDPLALEGVQIDGERMYARYRTRVIRYDDEGAVLGADVIKDDREYRWLLIGRRRLAVVSLFDKNQARLEGGLGMQTQRSYRVYGLSDNGRVESMVQLPLLNKRLVEAAAIDGWILLSTDAETLALPAPPTE